MNNFINTREAAQMTGYSRSSLYRLVREGKIPYHRPNGSGRLLFSRTEVQAWMTKCIKNIKK